MGAKAALSNMNITLCSISTALPALSKALISLAGTTGLLLLSACATTRPGPTSIAGVHDFVTCVKPGDFVECQMKIGSTKEFTVLAVNSGWLIGKETSAYAGDIVSVKITRGWIKRRNDAAEDSLALYGALFLLVH